MQFDKNVKEKLGHYVYALVDPDTDKIFYVGKASANERPFDHLKSPPSDADKSLYIENIRNLGGEPRVDILRHGLESEKVALEVEAAVIDAIGLENLTNAVRGQGVERGRATSDFLAMRYGAEPIDVNDITENCIAFFINKTYSPTMSDMQLYDATRQFWHQVSKSTRESSEDFIALAVVEGIVVAVFSIEAWLPAGSTVSTRTFSSGKEEKWEFVGQRLEHEYEGCLLIKDGKPVEAIQKGYSYFPPRN